MSVYSVREVACTDEVIESYHLTLQLPSALQLPNIVLFLLFTALLSSLVSLLSSTSFSAAAGVLPAQHQRQKDKVSNQPRCMKGSGMFSKKHFFLSAACGKKIRVIIRLKFSK